MSCNSQNKKIQKFMKFRDIVASHDPTGTLISEGLFKKLKQAMSSDLKKFRRLTVGNPIQQSTKKTKQSKEISLEKTNDLLFKSLEKKQKQTKTDDSNQTILNKNHVRGYPEGYTKQEIKSAGKAKRKRIKLPLSAGTEIQKPFDFKKSADFESLKSEKLPSTESDEDWLNKVFGAK